MLHPLSSRSPRSARFPALLATLSLAATTAACSSDDSTLDEPRDTEVSFASLSGDIVTDNDDTATLSLAVVAPPDAPVWSGIHEFHLDNDHPDGGDDVFVGDSVQIERNEEANGHQLGTILVELPEDQANFELSTVRLAVDEGGTLADHDVGDISVRQMPDYPGDGTPSIEPIDDYPGGSCPPAAIPSSR